MPPYSSFGFITSVSRFARICGTRSMSAVATVRRPLGDEPRPRHVRPRHAQIGGVEQTRKPVVGQDGKERLLVRDLAAKRVGHADGASGVRVGQRLAVVRTGQMSLISTRR